MDTTTFHTYPDLVTEAAERKCAICWGSSRTPSAAVSATLREDAQRIILRVRHGNDWHTGYAPGGIA